jgi:hypothetical protein
VAALIAAACMASSMRSGFAGGFGVVAHCARKPCRAGRLSLLATGLTFIFAASADDWSDLAWRP